MSSIFKRIVTLLLGCLALGLAADDGLSLTRLGEPVIERIPFTLRLFDDNWRSYTQGYHGFSVLKVSGDASDGRMEALLECGGLPKGTLNASIRRTAPGNWQYSAQAEFSAPAKLKFIGLTTYLPIESFCGRELLADGIADGFLFACLPEQYVKDPQVKQQKYQHSQTCQQVNNV